ncbi:phage holin family protein [Rhodococcus phenolicus]|uniref:phage holin family protein n=1 Tax=Rhodococcus phenolicus TaxID=263849 RepID=UPI000834D415|nr:phage holin family protein [Rhodococcus phenolicus]
MTSLILRLVINAVGLWLAATLVDGVRIGAMEGDDGITGRTILALLVLALIFTIVNALVKPLVKLLSLPLLILTLGLFTLVINALMLWLTSWISSFTDYGLTLSGFWAAFWGALIISVVNLVLGVFVPDGD